MTTIDDVLRRDLTDEQYSAAVDPSYEVLALACAGSGKSRTLAYRIARLIGEGVEPARLVAFTFTEKAADAIKLRVAQALSATSLEPTIVGAMFIGTIHAYCQAIISRLNPVHRQFDVIDENGLKLYLISRYRRLGLHRLQTDRGARYFATVSQVARAWALLNDELISIKSLEQEDPLLAEILTNLAEGLNHDQYVDFSLMIWHVVDLLGEGWPEDVPKPEHVMVDEYQDVNPAQAELIRRMHDRPGSLFVVGDDDQAIYGWRGADVSNIRDFSQTYSECSEHTLNENFRSIEDVVRISDQFVRVELGATRIEKEPRSVPKPVEGPEDVRKLWFPSRADEAAWVVERIGRLLGTKYVERDGTERGLTPADVAILMRSTRMNEQNGEPRHKAFTDALEAAGIPYTMEAGGGLLQRPQVMALVASFELLREGQPTRNEARELFDSQVAPRFPRGSFNDYTRVLAEWGRLIHAPHDGSRRRVYPQQLLHDMLAALRLAESGFDEGIMRDLGVLSRLLQDVESVYVSVDSEWRFREILNFINNIGDLGYDTSTMDLLRRPDAVTVATVHKVKGLEFPAVFVVDVENQRFPRRRRSYDGWVPTPLLADAMRRGAYQSTHEEEVRLFYTALTRAERYLCVSGAATLPNARRAKQPSSFMGRLTDPAIDTNALGEPSGLEFAEAARRIDETIVPTSFSQIRYFLRCPADFRYRNIYGFSPPIKEMFGFGSTVHAALGALHEKFPRDPPSLEEAEKTAREVFHLKHIPPSKDPENRPGGYERARDAAVDILGSYAKEYGTDFARERKVEVPFEIPVEQAVISGAIDLLLRLDEQDNVIDAAVIDFKTMKGGDDPLNEGDLVWTELALQVQLYARGATEVLGENAKTGAVHLLRDGQRVEVPVDDESVAAAIANVEWAISRILDDDFPMRPEARKCGVCDFRGFCPQVPQAFKVDTRPPPIGLPEPLREQMALAFEEFDASVER